MHSADDLVMRLGDFNELVGMYIDGVHGGYVLGQRYLKEVMLLFYLKKGIMCDKYIV